ncbi:MAG: FecR domain-containing protein [Flavobacteriales bacterium]|nr:FecR domain-containing protein [Flavobacteriales bacterium]
MDALIAKYFFDELNQEEERQLLDWIAENPKNAEQFVHSKKLLTLSESENQVFNPNAEMAWEKVRQKLARKNNPGKLVRMVRNSFPYGKLLRIAASFFLLVGLGYTIANLDIFIDSEEGSSMVATQEEGLDEIIEISTTDDVKVLYLPDSSVVFLNRNSKIVYSKKFVGDKRNVYLEGESFFDVRPDADHPFCVFTSNTKTRVLGTSFNIKAYRESGETVVNVSHGKVVFFLEGTRRDRMMILGSQDRVVFDRDQVSLTKYRNVGSGYMAWMNDFEIEIDEVVELKINERLLLSPYSKEVVAAREARDPIHYINNVSNWNNTFEWKNHLVKKTMVEGELYSSASVVSFGHTKLKATFYNPDNEIIGAEIFVIKEIVAPGSIVEYKRKLDQYFDETVKVIVEVYHAEALEN